MFGIALNWLVGAFGVGRLLLVGVTLFSFVGASAGFYVKGRFDCVSIETQRKLLAVIDSQRRNIEDMEEAMELGQALYDDFTKTERENDEAEKNMPPPAAGSGCTDPGFLRWLGTLR